MSLSNIFGKRWSMVLDERSGCLSVAVMTLDRVMQRFELAFWIYYLIDLLVINVISGTFCLSPQALCP